MPTGRRSAPFKGKVLYKRKPPQIADSVNQISERQECKDAAWMSQQMNIRRALEKVTDEAAREGKANALEGKAKMAERDLKKKSKGDSGNHKPNVGNHENIKDNDREKVIES